MSYVQLSEGGFQVVYPHCLWSQVSCPPRLRRSSRRADTGVISWSPQTNRQHHICLSAAGLRPPPAAARVAATADAGNASTGDASAWWPQGHLAGHSLRRCRPRPCDRRPHGALHPAHALDVSPGDRVHARLHCLLSVSGTDRASSSDPSPPSHPPSVSARCTPPASRTGALSAQGAKARGWLRRL